jgi:hypothetical protein
MKSYYTVCALFLFAITTANGAPITTLYNTGVNNSGSVLANNAPDPHYTLIAPSPVVGPTFARTSASGFPISPGGPWVGDNTTSRWITPSLNATGPNGNYTYRTTFDLTGLDPSTASITGRWATDNPGLDILINGVSTGQVNTIGFTAFTPFSINTGFTSGINTLDFIVQEQGVVTGLRVEMTGTAAAAVPEPFSLGIFGTLTLGVVARRRLRFA